MHDDQLYQGLKQWHSVMLFAVAFFVLLSFINAWLKKRKNKPFTAADYIINRLALGFCHLQFLSGLLLYTHSPKVQFGNGALADESVRYYTVIHEGLMLAAIVLITLSVTITRNKPAEKKHATVVRFSGAGILIMAVALLMLKYEMLRFF